MVNTLDALRSLAIVYSRADIPEDAEPFHSQNSSAITSTTEVAIKAAPGAGKRLFLTKMEIAQPTAAETPLITIQDTAGTPVVIGSWQMGAADHKTVKFEPPVALNENVGVEGKAGSSDGDTIVTLFGLVGSTGSLLSD